MLKNCRFKNQKGLTLIELIIALGVTAILSMFTFESVRQVIMTSMTVQRKADFESLAADVRILLHKLDQCTCNFQGITWAGGGSTTINLSGNGNTPANTLTRFPTAGAAAIANCTGTPKFTVAAQGTTAYQGIKTSNPTVTSLQLVDVQYIQPLNVMRAILRMQATVPQQLMALPTTVTRDYPLLFSMKPTNPPGGVSTIVRGCVGLTP